MHGGDWIACDVVSPGMGFRCLVSIASPSIKIKEKNKGLEWKEWDAERHAFLGMVERGRDQKSYLFGS